MIKIAILIIIYFTIGCIFGLSVAAFDEDLDDGVALVFAVLSVVFWPAMVMLFAATAILMWFRRLR